MLAVSPLRSSNRDGIIEDGETESSSFSIGSMDDFLDFSAGNLLDSIDFDDLFVGIHDADVLPDLEMDPELLAEFSISGGEEYSDGQFNSTTMVSVAVEDTDSMNGNGNKDVAVRDGNIVEHKGNMEEQVEGKDLALMEKKSPEVRNQRKDFECREMAMNSASSKTDGEKGRKWSSSKSKTNSTTTATTNNNSSKNDQGKRKSKVDWTPELHRRFVQAVEQLGVDKAVPSRILELMGIDCLTRHNIASHLQKYRSHRKHLLAREAEAATWSQKRQIYGVSMAAGRGKGNVSPWHVPTVGFPPAITPPPQPPQGGAGATAIHAHHYRPLHVWGHPTHHNPQMMPPPMWPPNQLVSSHTPPPTSWAPHVAVDPAFWHPPRQHVPNSVTSTKPRFLQPLATSRFVASPIPCILPRHQMFRPELGVACTGQPSLSGPNPPMDFHPTKESIDTAIGDVLAKPYLPLPIGLKPPAMDSVLVELQRQGVSKIPPSCA